MNAVLNPARCPNCGSELGSDPETEGVCPRCLLSLALLRSIVESVPAGDTEAPTLERPATGQILGERYQIRELLGWSEVLEW